MRHKQMQGISLLSLACVKLTLSTDASQADERHLRYISLSVGSHQQKKNVYFQAFSESFKTLTFLMTFVERSPKAGWLSLKVLQKQDEFR